MRPKSPIHQQSGNSLVTVRTAQLPNASFVPAMDARADRPKSPGAPPAVACGTEKGKPVERRGRKARDLPEREAAQPPKETEKHMRYQPAHAAKSGSVPFTLHGHKPARAVLAAATAGILGLVSTALVPSPAMADANGTVSVTVAPSSVTEGQGTLTFTIVNTGANAANVTLGGTATPVTDFTAAPAVPATVAAAGSATIVITPLADLTYEGGNETVIITAADSVTGGVDHGSATGTIVDAETTPPTYALSALPNPVGEAAGTTAITATLTKKSSTATTILLSTTNGTARAGYDYVGLTSFPLTVPAGSLTASTNVTIIADGITDSAAVETFNVTSSSAGLVQPTNAAAGAVTVSINDANVTSEVKVTGGGSVAEGDTLTIPVTLTPASEKEVKVDWESVAPGGGLTPVATAGTDFVYPANRTVTIPAGQTAGSIAIQTTKDNIFEENENFKIQLTNPQNTTIDAANSSVAGLITTGKDAPKVKIEPTTVTEGDSGRTAATFTATLSAASTQTVKIAWSADADGVGLKPAIPGTDFVTKSGVLTFAPGVTTQTFTVEIIGDTIDEASTAGVSAPTDGETFKLTLSAPPAAKPSST